MAQVKQGLDALNTTETSDYAQKVAAGIEGNAYFPAPPVSAQDLEGRAKAIRDGQAEIDDLTNQMRAKQSEVRSLVDDTKSALNNLGNYVQLRADELEKTGTDGAQVIHSANMETRDSSATPVGHLPASDKVSIHDGHDDGFVDVSCKKIHGASTYQWWFYVGEDPFGADAKWELRGATTKTSASFGGFAAGSRVWMKMQGVGAAGPGDFSQPVSDIVT